MIGEGRLPLWGVEFQETIRREERKRLTLLTLVATATILFLITLLSGLFWSLKGKALSGREDSLKREIGELESHRNRIETGIAALGKAHGPSLALLNGAIEKKAFPLDKELRALRENPYGVGIVTLNFSTVDIMEVEVSSSSLDGLMNFAQSLEKRGYRVSITGENKDGALYNQDWRLEKGVTP